MFKERIFRKTITMDNFKIVPEEQLAMGAKPTKGKVLKKDAELVAQVYYTPRGFSCEIEYFSPLDTWNAEQFCRLEGISEETPEGGLIEQHFDTQLAAMHFVTRRLKRLGWEPLDNWHSA